MADYDAYVRKLQFPSTVTTQVNDVLAADKTLIADLDAVGAASSANEYNRVINAVVPDYKGLASSISALDAALQ